MAASAAPTQQSTMTESLRVGLVLLSLAGLVGVAGRVPPCDPAKGDVCDLERAEDLVFLPGSEWFAVSTAAPRTPLVFIHAPSRRRVAVAAPLAANGISLREPGGAPAPVDAGAADCDGPPQQFHAGGNDVRRMGREWRLIVLNRSSSVSTQPDRIEFFAVRIRGGPPRARWIGCIKVPAAWSLNDVALAADGNVYGSHQFDRPATAAAAAVTRQQWLDGQPTGYAVLWQRNAGWSRVPDTEVSFANGIAVSRDDHQLAVAGTYSKSLVLVDRHSGIARRVALPHTPDNLTTLADGSFLSVGHTGVPVIGVDPCRPADALPCGFPFSVAQIVPGRGDEAPRVRVLLEHDGSRIPGASVAAPHDGKLYLGSYFGDRVTVVDAPTGTPRD